MPPPPFAHAPAAASGVGEGVRAGCPGIEAWSGGSADAPAPGGEGCWKEDDAGRPSGVDAVAAEPEPEPEPTAAATPSPVVCGAGGDEVGGASLSAVPLGVAPSALAVAPASDPAPPLSPPPPLSAASSATSSSGSPSVGSSGGSPGWQRLHHRRHPSRVMWYTPVKTYHWQRETLHVTFYPSMHAKRPLRKRGETRNLTKPIFSVSRHHCDRVIEREAFAVPEWEECTHRHHCIRLERHTYPTDENDRLR